MAAASRWDRGRRSHRRTAGLGPAERREILGRRPPATLAVSFARTPRGGAQITVHRDDGVIINVGAIGPREPVPHDLAHLVVESMLGIRLGLWGSIAAGAIFPGMEVVGGRLPPRARERSGAILKENHEDIVLAELAVGLVVNSMTGRWGALRKATGLISGGGDQDQVARVLKATGEKLPAAWVAQVPNLCKAMAQMAGRWNRVPVGGELAVTWRPSSQS